MSCLSYQISTINNHNTKNRTLTGRPQRKASQCLNLWYSNRLVWHRIFLGFCQYLRSNRLIHSNFCADLGMDMSSILKDVGLVDCAWKGITSYGTATCSLKHGIIHTILILRHTASKQVLEGITYMHTATWLIVLTMAVCFAVPFLLIMLTTSSSSKHQPTSCHSNTLVWKITLICGFYHFSDF